MRGKVPCSPDCTAMFDEEASVKVAFVDQEIGAPARYRRRFRRERGVAR